MITVDQKMRKPIYEQLVDNVKNLVTRGVMQPDEQLPSVRALATELAVNPNTVQKAYSELERQKIIYSLPGRGNYVCPDIQEIKEMRQAEYKRGLKSMLKGLVAAGMGPDELKDAVANILKEVTDDDGK